MRGDRADVAPFACPAASVAVTHNAVNQLESWIGAPPGSLKMGFHATGHAPDDGAFETRLRSDGRCRSLGPVVSELKELSGSGRVLFESGCGADSGTQVCGAGKRGLRYSIHETTPAKAH